MTEKPLVILAGPTAVGKTALSIRLAKKIGGSIISADSMQIYQGMDIGSAKPTQAEMQGIRHYLIDELPPTEEFHIVRFQQMAKAAMEEICREGKIPITAGGTGFYIQALLYDIDFSGQESDGEYRRMLEQFAEEHGNGALYEKLRQVDPASCQTIHANNRKRVIRALEFYHITGKRISEHNEEERKRRPPYNFAYFVLTEDRQELYQKIDRRVDDMMERGLLDEVRRLKEMGCRRGMVSMQGLGYKELLDHLDGRLTLEEAVSAIKRETRHFAKRQLTWFRREPDAVWLDKAAFDHDEDAILRQICRILEEKKIIKEQL